MRASLSRRSLVLSRIPSLCQLFDRGDVNDAVMQTFHELRHEFVEEGLVGMDRIAGERATSFRDVRLQELDHLENGQKVVVYGEKVSSIVPNQGRIIIFSGSRSELNTMSSA